jgi:proline iminopeptidase
MNFQDKMINMQNSIYLLFLVAVLFQGCSGLRQDSKDGSNATCDYLDFSNRDDQFTGGIKMIPISTPKGEYKVWTKRVGNNPDMKLLLLHGGPGGTHEVFLCADGYLPAEGIEYIYYDQLGSYYSDQPSDTSLWTLDRFVEEVEQVRIALNLDKNNFYLLGQSWGGMLAMQYALKYQENLKGLIISNMMSSAPEYNQYAQEVLGPMLDPDVYDEVRQIEANNDFGNPRYMELLMNHYYPEHLLRMPLEQWPEAINRAFKHMNQQVYVFMQGFSEFGMTGDATLRDWDVSAELPNIYVPTLVIGATHDTMNPEHMKWMSEAVQHGRFLLCPDGSHLSQYDDQKVYFKGLIQFIKDVDKGIY